jgi:hypothetical protein
MQVLDIIILALATWRLSSLLVDPEDDGPWELFGKFRHLVGVRRDKETGLFYGKNVAAQALLCIFCSSVWVGITIAALYILFPSIAVMASLPLALSTGAILLERIING